MNAETFDKAFRTVRDVLADKNAATVIDQFEKTSYKDDRQAMLDKQIVEMQNQYERKAQTNVESKLDVHNVDIVIARISALKELAVDWAKHIAPVVNPQDLYVLQRTQDTLFVADENANHRSFKRTDANSENIEAKEKATNFNKPQPINQAELIAEVRSIDSAYDGRDLSPIEKKAVSECGQARLAALHGDYAAAAMHYREEIKILEKSGQSIENGSIELAYAHRNLGDAQYVGNTPYIPGAVHSWKESYSGVLRCEESQHRIYERMYKELEDQIKQTLDAKEKEALKDLLKNLQHAEIEIQLKFTEEMKALANRIIQASSECHPPMPADSWEKAFNALNQMGKRLTEQNECLNQKELEECFVPVSVHGIPTRDVVQRNKHDERTEVSDKALEVRDQKHKWENAKHKFEQQYGVKVVEKDGHVEYHITANGNDMRLYVNDKGGVEMLDATQASKRKDVHLYTTKDGDQNSLMEGGKKLADFIAAKEKELHAQYGITFIESGKPVRQQTVVDETTGETKVGTIIKTQQPRVDQLYGLQAALEHSKPASFEGVQFAFLDRPSTVTSDGKPVTGGEWFRNDDTSAGIVIVSPNLGPQVTGITNQDVGAVRPDGRVNSIEGIFSHELGHQTELRQGANFNSEQYQKQFAEAAGWVEIQAPWGSEKASDGHRYVYAMKAKDGSCYINAGPNLWVRVDREGNLLDGQGKALLDSAGGKVNFAFLNTELLNKVGHYNNQEMREHARVRPYSEYLDNPKEVFAEGMRAMRGGEKERAALCQNCPELYKLIKEADQKEIDEKYKPPGSHIRDVDGHIVSIKDHPEAVKRVHALEQKGF